MQDVTTSSPAAHQPGSPEVPTDNDYEHGDDDGGADDYDDYAEQNNYGNNHYQATSSK